MPPKTRNVHRERSETGKAPGRGQWTKCEQRRAETKNLGKFKEINNLEHRMVGKRNYRCMGDDNLGAVSDRSFASKERSFFRVSMSRAEQEAGRLGG